MVGEPALMVPWEQRHRWHDGSVVWGAGRAIATAKRCRGTAAFICTDHIMRILRHDRLSGAFDNSIGLILPLAPSRTWVMQFGLRSVTSEPIVRYPDHTDLLADFRIMEGFRLWVV